MTQAQMTRILKKRDSDILEAIQKAAEYTPSIAKKFINGRLWYNTQFTLSETKAILKELHCSKLQCIYIEENFQEVPETDVYTIKGTNKFVMDWKKNPHIQCCNTCKYICGKVAGYKMPQPFCKVYNTYLYKYNVYEDYCSSYEYLELPKPRKWFKENAARNLNMYGETDTVNGVKKEEFVSGEEWGNRPVELVNQVGFDK